MTDSPAGTGPDKATPDKAALAVAAGLAAVAAVILWDARTITVGGGYAGIGPATFPFVIGAGLALLALGTAVAAWRGRFPPREQDEIAPIAWIVGGLVAQLLLLKVAGFAIATGLLFAATARAFGRGPLWLTVPIGIVLSFGIWLVFAKVLLLSLPAGPVERALF